jgi:subtilase family serine protease
MPTTLSGVAAAALLVFGAGAALAGAPYPTRQTPAAVDQGPFADAADPITVTVALNLRDPSGAETLLRRLGTRGDPLYRHWLTPAEFAARFGPTDQAVETVRSALAGYNLRTDRTAATLLHVTGRPADLERAFGVTLHSFSVPATATTRAYAFRAPLQRPAMPAAIAPYARAVLGLDTRPAFSPHMRRADPALRPAHVVSADGAPKTPDQPGYWTVKDFDVYYHAAALQKAGVTGAGQTLGIMTLASFTQSDAYTYWKSAGLTVPAGRITEVPVDGGAGPPSDDAGSDETTLDVEQSGGIATGANILVYEAPNTNQGFVDVFGQAVSDNTAETLSISWGEWEWFCNLAGGVVTDPRNGSRTDQLVAIHGLLVQAGLQGQSTFAAAGDAGAYDANDGLLPPDFSLALSVDYPASDPAITAAGGTTLAGTQVFSVPGGSLSITVPAERVWGWDYLSPLCVALKLDPIECGIFPVGGGGGVSIEFPLPAYQSGVKGVQASAANQVFIDEDDVPPKTIYALPAGYAGRNVPDISLNADPETGYILGYTSSAPGGIYTPYAYVGGTSFVAPQLNGVTQLLLVLAGKRLGLLNPLLYKAAFSATGKDMPINVIKYGGNEFYKARAGYSPAAGLGTLNIANLPAILY